MTKNFLLLSLICLTFSTCKKEKRGNVDYKLKFTNSNQITKLSLLQLMQTDSLYTKFGSYIGSITPTKYLTSFNFLFCQSDKYVVNYTGNHWEDSSTSNPYLNVDFSQNKEIAVDPALMVYTNQNWIGNQQLENDEPTFNYFSFTAYYFKQEFELPAQYSGVTLKQLEKTNYFNSDIPERNGNVVKALSSCLFLPVKAEWRNLRFNFGVYNPKSHPFILNDTSTKIHGYFTPVTLKLPSEGETKTIYSTINFNTENLIQLYAGTDNIPYTADDVMVYAPNYYERLHIKMAIQ